MDTDIALEFIQSQNQFDIVFDLAINDMKTDDSLVTMTLLSIFTDARASDDDPLPDSADNDRRGFWGEKFSDRVNDRVGSKLWLGSRDTAITKNAQKAEDYIKESLQWMLQEGVVVKIDVETGINKDVAESNRLHFKVTLYRRTQDAVVIEFDNLWEGLT